jgi:hypothetical protein
VLRTLPATIDFPEVLLLLVSGMRDRPDSACAVSAVGVVFPKPRRCGVHNPRPLRPPTACRPGRRASPCNSFHRKGENSLKLMGMGVEASFRDIAYAATALGAPGWFSGLNYQDMATLSVHKNLS